LIQHQQQQYHSTKAGASSTTTASQHEGWSIININIGWHLQHEAEHLINISTRLEIFSTRLASQQHQHEAGNIQHEAGITTTSARRKSSARGWHHNNISMRLEIFNTRLASTTSARSWKSSALGSSTTSTLEIFSTTSA
jgi:hypothetical protein